MVDVGSKRATARRAVAAGSIRMSASAFAAVRDDVIAKGDVLGVARIAGIQAAKKTSDLIPLCHPLALTRVALDFELLQDPPGVRCTATAETHGQTGVEMEAYTAVVIAGITLIDMLKGVDPDLELNGVRLLEKTGGKSDWRRR